MATATIVDSGDEQDVLREERGQLGAMRQPEGRDS